jgi:hypothetical protein
MAQCSLCGGEALQTYETRLTKKVSGIAVHASVPIDVCLTCKNAEQKRDRMGNLKLLGISIIVAIVFAIITQSGWALIMGVALGGFVSIPLKPLIIARSKFNEHPAILAKKQEGFKLTRPSR